MILKWIVSIIAVANCTMIRYGDQSTWCSNMNELSLFNFNVDIIRHQCLVYDRSFEHDAATKTAQAFACLGTIFAVFPMLKVVALQLFLHWKPVLVWKAIWIKLLEAILSQATFFSGFATDICVWDLTIKCFPGPAGIINVINVILLSVLCWLCWGMAPQTCPSLMSNSCWLDSGLETKQFLHQLMNHSLHSQMKIIKKMHTIIPFSNI